MQAERNVDIDEQVLMKYVVRAKPLVSDYINRRNTPLRIDIYKGSIASSEECLLGVDAVIAIELIEHLYPEELNNVPYNVFGYSRPKLAIFSTPNFDYNPLFNLTFSRGFRHEDHKFEWTRKQFEDWCYNICYRFPNYQVALIGVGDPPASQNNVGHVTQIGVFIRNDIRDIDLNDDIYSSEFPTIKDDRTRDQKLLDEIKYHINRYINMSKYFNRELEWCEIPIDNILEFMHPMITTIEELREFLIKNHCKMDCNNKVLVEQMQVGEDTDSESSSSGKSIEGINVSQISFVDIIEKWD